MLFGLLSLFLLSVNQSGGSLEFIIRQDGCLQEDVVRKFGWDLVKGLKYIHELGIILSDLSPAKVRIHSLFTSRTSKYVFIIRIMSLSLHCLQILLDGSHSLKYNNFCMSKAQGETLEDFLTLFSLCKESEEQNYKETFESIRKKLEGRRIVFFYTSCRLEKKYCTGDLRVKSTSI